MSKTLRRAGHQVRIVGHREKALSALQAGPFDVVLVDCRCHAAPASTPHAPSAPVPGAPWLLIIALTAKRDGQRPRSVPARGHERVLGEAGDGVRAGVGVGVGAIDRVLVCWYSVTMWRSLAWVLFISWWPFAGAYAQASGGSHPFEGQAASLVRDVQAPSLNSGKFRGEVSASGAFSYEYVIDVPSGRAGLQPRVSITYSSHAGNGIAGLGTHLAGVPAIQRADLGYGIQYTNSDTYVFQPNGWASGASDENRLLHVGGGAHHTRRDSGIRYFAYGNCGAGPCYWVGSAPDGTKYYFGGNNSANAGLNGAGFSAVVWERATALSPGQRGIDFWGLFRVEDRHGNYMTVAYVDAPGTLYPRRIEYMKHMNDASIATRSVDFSYITRSDRTPYPARMDRVIGSISVASRGQIIDCHLFAYSNSDRSGRSILKTVEHANSCDANRRTASVSNLNWISTSDEPSAVPGFGHQEQSAWADPTPTAGTSTPRTLVGDINGDGRDDVVRYSFGMLPSYCSGTSCFDAWIAYSLTEEDGGLGDVVHAVTAPDYQFGNDWSALLADVNADGVQDLVIYQIWRDYRPYNSTGAPLKVRVAHGRRGSPAVSPSSPPDRGGLGYPTASVLVPFDAATSPIDPSLSLAPWAGGMWTVRTGDINADQRRDLIFVNAFQRVAVTLMATGDLAIPFEEASRRSWSFAVPGQPHCYINPVYNTPTSEVCDEAPKMRTHYDDNDDQDSPYCHVLSGADVGDVDGDGRDDLVLSHSTPLQSESLTDGKLRVVRLLGSDNGLLFPVVRELGLPNRSRLSTVMADFNGDGREDVVLTHSGASTVDPSTGQLAEPMTLSVEDGEGNRPLGREVYTLLGPIFAPSNPHDPLFIVGPQSSETYPNWFAPFGTLSHSSPHVAVAADLDGDRLPDLVHSYFGGLGEDVSVHEPDGMGDFVRGGVGAEDDDAWVLASADFENPTGFRSDVDGYFHDSYFKHIVVDMDGDGNSDILRVAHSTFAVGTHYASGPDSPLVSMPGYAAHWYHGKRNAADQRPGIRSAPGTLLASSPIGRRDWRGSGPGDCSNSNALLGDMNGDGLVDLLFASSFGLDLYIQTQRSPELLHEVISDIGGSLAVQYQAPLSFAAAVQTTEEPSCSGGTAHSTCGAPASPGVWLVGRVVSEDGRGFEQSATYDYRNFRVVRGAARDRKMLGFETIVRLDERTGRRDTTTYYQDVGRHGLARRSEVHTAHGGHYWKWSDVVHEWAATPRYGAVVAGLEETKRTTTLFEDDWPVSEVIEHSEYDEHGYLTLRKSCPSYDACSALGTRFTHDVTAWRLGRVDYVTSWYGPRLTSNLRYLYSPGSMDAESIRQWWQPYAETASCTNTTELECGQEVLAGHGRWITIEKNRQFRWGVLTYREDADSHGEVFGLDTRWWTYTATHTNALGHVVRRRHDARGAVSASIDANLVTRHYDYDDFGRLVGERSSVGALTNLGRVTHADDRASRRFTTEAWADATSRQVETSFYGGFGDVYRKDRIDVDGTSIVRVEWTREWIAQPGGYSLLRSGRSDPYRCTLAQCDSAPRTEVTYDARARPLRVERVVDGLRRTMFTYSYGRDQQSATGAAVVVTDALGNVNEYYLDQHRRLSRILDAKQAETTYQHDGVGRLIAVALPNGDAVSAAYDLWGRRYRYSDSVSGDAWYSYYDIGDRLRERVDAEGRGFEQTYDALGRLDTRSAGGATTVFGYDDPTVSYGIGRLTSVTGAAPGVETRLAYDWAGRTARSEVLFPEYPDPFVREQEFDDLGRRTLTTLPDGTTLQNIHHPHGGPVSDVVVNGETLARYPEHTASGRALQIEAWRSSQDLLAVSYLTYDEENRLDEFVSELPQSLGLSDRTIQHYAYDYRDDGRILAVHDVRSNTQQGSVNTADDNFYSYDSLGRLVGAQGAYGTHVYKYDGLGNFSMFENVEVVGPYSCVSPGWACFEGIGDTGQTVWSYRNDRAGHRVAFEIGANETTYEYDQYGQLIAVLGSAGSLAAFEYDHAGRRVRKDELSSFGPGVTTLYPFDDYEVRYNNDDGPNSASVTRHYYGPSGHIASETAGVLLPNQLEPSDIETFLSKWSGDTSAGPPHGRWYNLPNHVGSTALTLHQDGVTRSHEAFASRVVYAPFGGVVEDASFGRDIATRKFAGKELDASTGLSYFGARYYDSVTGRFLTPDQNIVSHGTDPQGFNRYAYTLNDPVSYTDPTGEYPFVAGYNAAQFGLDASAKLTAFEQSIVTDRPGLGGVFFNTAVSSVADVSRGLLAITQVGTGAAAGVERISNAEDGWDVVIGVAQVLKDAGEVSGTVLHGTGAAVKMTTAAVKPASMAASSVSKASVNSARVAGTSRDAAGRLRNADGTFAPDGGRVRTPGGTHGNTAGDQPATLYEMYDADGNFLKHGISQDPASRYSRPELRGGFLVETESGPRKAMLKRERELVETNPGPLNREPWAGRRTQ